MGRSWQGPSLCQWRLLLAPEAGCAVAPEAGRGRRGAGLCPLLEGRAFKMRAIGRARPREGPLSFFLGNTLPVLPLASPSSPRPLPVAEEPCGAGWSDAACCAQTRSRRPAPLISPYSGRGGSGALETPHCPQGEVVPSPVLGGPG